MFLLYDMCCVFVVWFRCCYVLFWFVVYVLLLLGCHSLVISVRLCGVVDARICCGCLVVVCVVLFVCLVCCVLFDRFLRVS